jgi:choline dehydrogenase-like flavoprotein
MTERADIVIIGSGIGGATIALSLAPSGRSIVILERGERLGDSDAARSDRAIFRDGVFRSDEEWLDGSGRAFNPGNYYNVGGNSKFFGAVMLRYRREDFGEMQHLGGVSPAWPISYDEMELWYQKAEDLFEVRGDTSQDPTEPTHSGGYPFPPVPDEPTIANMRQRLTKAGVTPSSLPLAVDHKSWLSRAKTPWDAFPDTTGAKKDAESAALAKALQYPNVSLVTGAKVTGLGTGKDGRISFVDFGQTVRGTSARGEQKRLEPKICILSAGAVNSAALLLRSANDANPTGLANGSDTVGRYFMNHNCSAILALHPWRKNTSVYQKTLQFNDFYLSGGPSNRPLGNIQLLGKISGQILASQSALPVWMAQQIAARSVDWYAMSEDLPDYDSRVSVTGGRVVLDWKRTNLDAHKTLVQKAKSVLRKAGFPILVSRAFDRKTPSHQCGTTRFGADPKTSVLDLHCRSHDHSNLYVVDAGFLPTSAAVNPALTIAAQALRVGNYIKEKDLAV